MAKDMFVGKLLIWIFTVFGSDFGIHANIIILYHYKHNNKHVMASVYVMCYKRSFCQTVLNMHWAKGFDDRLSDH